MNHKLVEVELTSNQGMGRPRKNIPFRKARHQGKKNEQIRKRIEDSSFLLLILTEKAKQIAVSLVFSKKSRPSLDRESDVLGGPDASKSQNCKKGNTSMISEKNTN